MIFNTLVQIFAPLHSAWHLTQYLPKIEFVIEFFC